MRSIEESPPVSRGRMGNLREIKGIHRGSRPRPRPRPSASASVRPHDGFCADRWPFARALSPRDPSSVRPSNLIIVSPPFAPFSTYLPRRPTSYAAMPFVVVIGACGLPDMTSAKLYDFWTPSRLVMYKNQLILFLSSAFWGPFHLPTAYIICAWPLLLKSSCGCCTRSMVYKKHLIRNN